MKTKTNQYCADCPRAHNGLNGRYCEQLERYVEFDKWPACNS